jgi:hypothetical protein
MIADPRFLCQVEMLADFFRQGALAIDGPFEHRDDRNPEIA